MSKTLARSPLGIALGGGGAKGLAHIGILQVFAEAGVHFDVISGTSIGALVGAMYAAGKLPQLEKEALSIRRKDIPLLFSPTLSRVGLFSGKNVVQLLTQYLVATTFEELPKPFAAVSADLITGCAVTATTGELLPAIRASMSIPGVFTPVTSAEQVLVDGGIIDPVPVAAALQLGAKRVLAIDLFSNSDSHAPITAEIAEEETSTSNLLGSAAIRLKQIARRLRDEVRVKLDGDNPALDQFNLITILERTQAIMQCQLTRGRLAESPPSATITPPLGEIGFLDFHQAELIIEIGRNAATEALPRILPALRS